MKKKLFACSLFLASLAGHAAMAQTLVLHHPDGTTTDVELFTQPRVEFQGDQVLILSTVLNIEYPKTEILSFTYKGSSLAITVPKANVSCDGERIVFHNIKAADQVAVYTTNGIRVPIRLTHTGCDAVLSLLQIPQGVYLLSVNGRTSKFIRP